MGTPTFINFSRVLGAVVDTVQRIEAGMGEAWQCRLDRYAFLRVSDDPYDGGYELAGELEPCEGGSKVAELAATGRPFGLAYLCQGPKATFAVYFTEVAANAHTLTVAVEKTFVYHRDDEHTVAGRWFQGWLVSLASAVGADVCVYGNREIIDKSMDLAAVLESLKRPRYEAVDPGQVLERLRKGDLLALPDPVFHAIKVELVGEVEIEGLLKQRAHPGTLEYKIAPGYHVLANIA